LINPQSALDLRPAPFILLQGDPIPMIRIVSFFIVLMVLIAPQAVRAQDATEILLRLDRLEAENRRLNGDVEKMQFQVQRLEEQLKKAQTDNDARLQELESGQTASTAPAKKPKRPAAETEAGVNENGVKDLASGETSPEPPAPANENDPASPDEKPITPKATGSAADDYAAANALLEGENLKDAELAFRSFLRAYPKDKLAADAMFGLGESLYRRDRYADAAEHYLNLSNQFPKSARAPEALLKLGMSLNALGARVEACSTYAEVTKKYPKAGADVREAVKRQRGLAKCS
jgi:tol-pal system protein YbgF